MQPSNNSAKAYLLGLQRLVDHHRGMNFTDFDVDRHVECGCLDLEAGDVVRELLRAGKTREEVLNLVAAPFLGIGDIHYCPTGEEQVAAKLFRESLEGRRTDESDERVRIDAEREVERLLESSSQTVKALARLAYAAIWMHTREDEDEKDQTLEEGVGLVAFDVFETGGEEEARIFVDGLKVELERGRQLPTGHSAVD